MKASGKNERREIPRFLNPPQYLQEGAADSDGKGLAMSQFYKGKFH